MSESQSSPMPAFEAHNSDYAKQQSLDFFSFMTPSDILAPHPDLFESELDSSLAGFDEVQLQLLTVDSNDAYSFLRSDTPTCGPPSTITVSSESAYESLSSHSDSYYNYPHSPFASSDYSFPLVDLDMDFQRIRVDAVSDYGGVNTQNSSALAATVDPNSFGALPPTPPHSPPLAMAKGFNRTSYSDYTPNSIPSSTASDYYGHVSYDSDLYPAMSSAHVSHQLPTTPRPSDERADSRKRYKCPTCPRAFARAYNLKTHLATHDPNRPKPHTCPHRNCGRSFSRKHDLGRHLVSIHRDDSTSPSPPTAFKKAIGVEKGVRSWCDSCGKGWFGQESNCDCQIK